MEKIFTDIYENSNWGNNGSIHYRGSSGSGSDIDVNINTYIPFLRKFIKTKNIKSVVDLGCGDFRCGKLIYNNLDIKYTGYDAYEKLINYHKNNISHPKYSFIHLDFFNKKEEIVSGDLCILKDVIQHWSVNNIYSFMDYLVDNKKFKYIILVNCGNQTQDNIDIEDGDYRPLSCNYLPLKKYNPVKVGNYDTKDNHVKEISIIRNDIWKNLELLTVYHFDNKVRLGINNDGGYVIGDLDGGYDCYISAGVSNEESFSRDFIKKYNMNKTNSYAFDGTINDYPYEYTRDITYVKKNIGSINDNNNVNLSYLIGNYNNIFLKMDIEGGEYPWLSSLSENQLNKFKQIVIEVHGITDDSYGSMIHDKIICLNKLKNTHYIIHAHGNNFGYVTNGIPYVVELTYVNKNYFTFPPELNRQEFPVDSLDFPNNTSVPDIKLNYYPFLHVQNE